MSLVYTISYPGTKVSVICIAHDKEGTTVVGPTTSVERLQRGAMLIYAEEQLPRSRETHTWWKVGAELVNVRAIYFLVSKIHCSEEKCRGVQCRRARHLVPRVYLP
jgi:hypothetical protein